jgi:D-alanine-D-alanine ligase-like ATP-grasp enzyme
MLVDLWARAGKVGAVLGPELEVLLATRRRPATLRGLEGAEAELYRELWDDAAAEVGAEVSQLGGFLELRRGDRGIRVRMQETPLDDPVTLALAADKPAVHELLATASVPVPEWLAFSVHDRGAAEAFVADGAPCLVKPAAGTAVGTGVTGGVRDARTLARAALRASRFGERLLVERQAPGDVHRLLYLDGELLDAVRRRPPTLVGDGRSSIGELIDAENVGRVGARGRRGLELLRVDLDLLLTLEQSGLTLRSVPGAGNELRVKTVSNQNRLEDNERVTVSHGLEAMGALAARTVGLRLAGVDAVTPDGRDGVVIEVNGTPGFNQHALVVNPGPTSRVAVPVLRRLLGC